MTSTTENPTCAALWKAVGANPSDSLPRLVLADWYDENGKSVFCKLCRGYGTLLIFAGPGATNPKHTNCSTCHGSCFIPDGRADLAAALRATSTRVPHHFFTRGVWSWLRKGVGNNTGDFVVDVWDHLTSTGRDRDNPYWKDFDSPQNAVLGLCLAWIEVQKK